MVEKAIYKLRNDKTIIRTIILKNKERLMCDNCPVKKKCSVVEECETATEHYLQEKRRF